MDNKVFNTVLASVVAGAMTMGVASFADNAAKKEAAKTTKTTTTTAKKTADAKATKDAKTEGHGDEQKGSGHDCGGAKCGDKKDEHHD
jgi:uncharacterized low-complexity protein